MRSFPDLTLGSWPLGHFSRAPHWPAWLSSGATDLGDFARLEQAWVLGMVAWARQTDMLWRGSVWHPTPTP